MKSVLIIGGGVIGACTAYYCAQRGYRVTVLERGAPDQDGCSFGNAGMIVPSHFVPLAAPGMVALGLKWIWNPESPFYIKPRLDWDFLSWGWKFYRAATPGHSARSGPLLRDLHLASRACFDELAASLPADFGFTKKGLLMLCRTQRTLEEEGEGALKAHVLGLPAEVLDARQAAALEPRVRMDIAGAVYFPKDCHLNPSAFMATLRQALVKAGVQSVWETEAESWRTRGDRVEAVRTTQGEFAAEEYVLAAGCWSSALARALRLNLPLQAGKGYSLTLPHPRYSLQICAILSEARVAVTPMNGSLRFGGTMEIAGLNEDINLRRVKGIIKAVPQYYPDFTPDDFSGIEPWRGLRPCTPDGLPYLGRTARYRNLTIATGHAMMGLSLGPITGKLAGTILAGEKPEVELQMLNPDRYQ